MAVQQTRDPALRDELRQAEVALRRQLPASVPKRVAAAFLGVSVTALDRWIDRGRLPVVASARGSQRLAIETGPLLELATKVEGLRRSGVKRGLLAEAMTELGWRDRGQRLILRADIACLPRPNLSRDELRQQFEETTPEERVLQMAALHRSMNTLSHGARQ